MLKTRRLCAFLMQSSVLQAWPCLQTLIFPLNKWLCHLQISLMEHQPAPVSLLSRLRKDRTMCRSRVKWLGKLQRQSLRSIGTVFLARNFMCTRTSVKRNTRVCTVSLVSSSRMRLRSSWTARPFFTPLSLSFHLTKRDRTISLTELKKKDGWQLSNKSSDIRTFSTSTKSRKR